MMMPLLRPQFRFPASRVAARLASVAYLKAYDTREAGARSGVSGCQCQFMREKKEYPDEGGRYAN